MLFGNANPHWKGELNNNLTYKTFYHNQNSAVLR